MPLDDLTPRAWTWWTARSRCGPLTFGVGRGRITVGGFAGARGRGHGAGAGGGPVRAAGRLAADARERRPPRRGGAERDRAPGGDRPLGGGDPGRGRRRRVPLDGRRRPQQAAGGLGGPAPGQRAAVLARGRGGPRRRRMLRGRPGAAPGRAVHPRAAAGDRGRGDRGRGRGGPRPRAGGGAAADGVEAPDRRRAARALAGQRHLQGAECRAGPGDTGRTRRAGRRARGAAHHPARDRRRPALRGPAGADPARRAGDRQRRGSRRCDGGGGGRR